VGLQVSKHYNIPIHEKKKEKKTIYNNSHDQRPYW